MHTYIHTCTLTGIHQYINTYKHTNTQTCTHTNVIPYTHTHMNSTGELTPTLKTRRGEVEKANAKLLDLLYDAKGDYHSSI